VIAHKDPFFFVPKGLETYGGVGGDIPQTEEQSYFSFRLKKRKRGELTEYLDALLMTGKAVLALLPLNSLGSMLSAISSENVV